MTEEATPAVEPVVLSAEASEVPVIWPEGEDENGPINPPESLELPDDEPEEDDELPAEPVPVRLLTPPRRDTKPATNKVSTVDDEVRKLKIKLEQRHQEQIELMNRAHQVAVFALERSFQQELDTLNRLINASNGSLEIPQSLRAPAATEPVQAAQQPRSVTAAPVVAPVQDAPRPSARKINQDIEQIAGSRGEPFSWLDMKRFLEAKGVPAPDKGMIQLDLDTMVRNRILKKEAVPVTGGSVVYYVSVSVPHKIVEMVRTLRKDVTAPREPTKPRRRI
jgi:hypothetical protein